MRSILPRLSRRRTGSRPRHVEALEFRLLLSTYTVANLNDAGPGSLRDAVQQANVDPGSDTITFAAGLEGQVRLTSGELDVTTDIAITGPTDKPVELGGYLSRVFSVAAGAALQISHVTLSGGDSAMNFDGGVVLNEGSLSVSWIDCIGEGKDGGGIYNAGTLVASDSFFGSETAPFTAEALRGGAVFNDRGGSASLVNCTISNTAESDGGGAIYTAGTLTIRNSTISGNGAGGGITIDPAATDPTTLYNTIVADNTGDDIVGTLDQHLAPDQVPSSYNLIGTGGSGGLVNGSRGNLVGAEPMLARAQNYGGPMDTMPPLPGSPAIGAGNAALAVDVDQTPLAVDAQGFPRESGGRVDIGAVQSQALRVNTTADGTDSRVQLPPGSFALSSAFNVARSIPGSQTIRFDPTVFAAGSHQVINIASDLKISGEEITIDGPGIDALTVLGHTSAFYVEFGSGRLTLSDMTLTTQPYGFAPLVDLGYAQVTHCLFDAPHVMGDNGGGIYVGRLASLAGTLSVTDCTFRNGSTVGGGGAIYNEGTAVISDSSFTGNAAAGSAGGGAILDYGSLTASGCTFAGNTANRGGGGAISGYGSMTLAGCTFEGNNASQGGGGAIAGSGNVSITNCTFVSNSAMGGGAIAARSLAARDSTFVNNTAAAAPGGVTGGASCLFQNCIIAGNTIAGSGKPSDLSNTAHGSNNLIGDGSGGLSRADHNILGSASTPIDPKLAPLGDYGGRMMTMPPLPGSPAIDAGSNALIPAGVIADQRGFYRVANGTVDIGAAEYNSVPLLPGDANGDRKVDFADLLALAQNYQKTPATFSDGDFNADGSVGFDDLLILAQNYGRQVTPAIADDALSVSRVGKLRPARMRVR